MNALSDDDYKSFAVVNDSELEYETVPGSINFNARSFLEALAKNKISNEIKLPISISINDFGTVVIDIRSLMISSVKIDVIQGDCLCDIRILPDDDLAEVLVKIFWMQNKYDYSLSQLKKQLRGTFSIPIDLMIRDNDMDRIRECCL